MRINHNRAFVSGMAVTLLAVCSTASLAASLFTHGNDDSLYRLDTDTRTVTLVGPNNVSSTLTEIDQSPAGGIYGADTLVNSSLYEIDSGSGAATNVITMNLPMADNVITAMEFVGDTLYGGMAIEGVHTGAGASHLVSIDTVTGDVTVIGETGISSPLGGMAYDGTTMYAASAGGTGSLYTIDLATGAATLVGDTGYMLTALEFGDSGVLFALPRTRSAAANHLLRIDPASAFTIDNGPIAGTPATGLVSLTSTPHPSPALETVIDVRPGNKINPVNPRSRGVINVAILQSTDVAIADVDIETVRLGDGAATVNYWMDTNGDNDPMLVMQFRVQDTGVACGDVEFVLTGQMSGGTSIVGADHIKTTGCR